MFKKISILLVPFSIMLLSCNSTGCYDQTDVKVNCSFYSLDTKKAVSLDSVTVWGVGSDSIIYDNSTLSEIALELNPKSNETKYVFQAVAEGYTFRDTLTFKHTNKPWFQSMDCGCMVFSTLDTCLTTGSIFQSVTIVNHEVINYDTEHVVLNI
jgi:hypothetical protein